jgi:hypothetical protein
MPGGEGPVPGTRMTEGYVRSVGTVAYLWGWPLVNMRNRLSIMDKLPGPGLLTGVVPAAPPGSACMLHDYITPEERLVALLAPQESMPPVQSSGPPADHRSHAERVIP